MTGPVCWSCLSRPAVFGDGPRTPCWPCLLELGHAVRDPAHLKLGHVRALLRAHGHSVKLRHRGPRDTLEWEWIP